MSAPEMGQVIPFIARVRESGDWSAAERARLEELADRLTAAGVNVEVIFGATDEGDPWCVVTDETGDVLIHVARIDGKFVVHSAVDDALSEGADLHAALRDRLDAIEIAAPHSATVLPFAARQGQTFLALVVAAAFFYETAGVAGPAEAAELPALGADPDPAPPPADAETPAQERELAVQGAALRDPAVQAVSAGVVAAATPGPALAVPKDRDPEPAAAPQPRAPVVDHADVALATAPQPEITLIGSDGDDLLIGTAADERIEGGDGADTLRGGGGHDSLLGGAGDDRIELTEDAVAEGGEGADTFVLVAEAGSGGPDRLLGVIFDFNAAAGDRIITGRGHQITVPPGPGEPPAEPQPSSFDVSQTPPPQDPPPPETGSFGPATLGPVVRVEVDLDGDGSIDGYVLVGLAAHPPAAPAEEAPIIVTGQPLPLPDPFG